MDGQHTHGSGGGGAAIVAIAAVAVVAIVAPLVAAMVHALFIILTILIIGVLSLFGLTGAVTAALIWRHGWPTPVQRRFARPSLPTATQVPIPRPEPRRALPYKRCPWCNIGGEPEVILEHIEIEHR